MRSFLAPLGLCSLLSLALLPGALWAAPPAPSNFVAADANDCGVIKMSWDPVAGVLGYNIYRGGTLIAIAGPSVTMHLDYEMPAPAAYNYCIEAFDGGGISPQACDGASLVAHPVSVAPWEWFNDVFPSDPAIVPGTPAFDNNTAVLATGHNPAPCVGALGRDVMTDNKVTLTTVGAVVRVDMIFRIKPGPGNYCITGLVGSGLDVPPGGACVASVPGDGTFWGDLMAAPGMFATPGAVALHAAAPSGWDSNVWNSRECEMVAAGVYETTDAALPGTDILPDDLFCPGTHVEYYFRVEFVAGPVVNVPDPDCVIQMKAQGSIDGHRWEQFGVLPDRWKDPAFGGLGNACALVVDLDDGYGNERVWVSTADSSGATAPSRYGAHNGWHAVGKVGPNPVDVDDPANNRRPDATVGFVETHGGQPGTTWDLYNVKGAQFNCQGNAGTLGGRLGVVPAGTTPPGPTQAMLDAYYNTIILLTGDRTTQILGPIPDRSQDDVTILQNFLINGTVAEPRGLIVEGSGFAQSEDAAHPVFPATFLGAFLRDPDYRVFSGNTATDAELLPDVFPFTNTYRVVNATPVSNDVLDVNAAVVTALAAGEYEPVGALAPYFASVFTGMSPPRNFATLLDGWNIEDLRGRFNTTLTSSGRRDYHRDVIPAVIGPFCDLFTGPPVAVEERDGGGGRSPSGDFLIVAGNPLKGREAAFELGLTEAAHLRVGVYDLAGRLVRLILDRRLEAGAHSLTWDGADESGGPAASGLYFIRARNLDRGTMVGSKLAMLR